MKKLLKLTALFMALVLIFTSAACSTFPSSSQPEEPDSGEKAPAVDRAKEWFESGLANNTLFSFAYDGKESSEFLSSWTRSDSVNETDGITVYETKYTSPDGLEVLLEADFDKASASVEWVIHFKNTGKSNSGVISSVLPADNVIKIENPVLTTTVGSAAAQNDFEPVFTDLTETPSFSMKNSGGRSSSEGWPYFDISNGTSGVMGAIGWTGNWEASFDNDNGEISFKAGMQTSNYYLYPDEEVRTPSILLQFFDGDRDDGHNAFRKLILDRYTPTGFDGEKMTNLPMCINNWGSSGEETLLNNIEILDRVALEYEVMWIDAGWYGTDGGTTSGDGIWAQQVGNMYANPELYPEGFINVSKSLESRGKKLMLWFEPERAMSNTQLVVEHPEYFYDYSSASGFYLLKMSDDSVAEMMTDMIDGFIKEFGLGLYRQDFNCSPINYWLSQDKKDGPDRDGITEIKYIQNEYKFLDELLERNPGLVIDNCASGGRRLDIEMAKRSVPLWRTDYTVENEGVRAINYNLSWWLPLHGGGCSREGRSTDYQWRSILASGLPVGISSRDLSWYRKSISDYYRCRELSNGDYYILSAGYGDRLLKQNAVYEFFKPEEGKGYLVAFRPSGSPESSESYALKGLNPDTVYVLSNPDGTVSFESSGKDLMTSGLKLEFQKTVTSVLIFINEK